MAASLSELRSPAAENQHLLRWRRLVTFDEKLSPSWLEIAESTVKACSLPQLADLASKWRDILLVPCQDIGRVVSGRAGPAVLFPVRPRAVNAKR